MSISRIRSSTAVAPVQRKKTGSSAYPYPTLRFVVRDALGYSRSCLTRKPLANTGTQRELSLTIPRTARYFGSITVHLESPLPLAQTTITINGSGTLTATPSQVKALCDELNAQVQ